MTIGRSGDAFLVHSYLFRCGHRLYISSLNPDTKSNIGIVGFFSHRATACRHIPTIIQCKS